MRLISMLVSALALLAFPAVGQVSNPCNVPEPSIIKMYQDWAANSKAQCAPAPIGVGTSPFVRFNKAGMHGWVWCPMIDGTWSLAFGAATWDALKTIPLVSDAAEVAASADPVATLTAIASRNVNVPMSDPTLTPVWCPNVKDMYASRPADVVALPPPPPPTPVPAWVVATNGTSPTRAAFAVVNGVRSFSSKATVAVGASCSTAVKLVEGRNTYLQVAPGLVALCVLAP
jgi:hypothetical protein